MPVPPQVLNLITKLGGAKMASGFQTASEFAGLRGMLGGPPGAGRAAGALGLTPLGVPAPTNDEQNTLATLQANAEQRRLRLKQLLGR